MDRADRYHDDSHAWSEQQVQVLRRLARSRHELPNALDLERVAEEIEDVGTGQRRAAESLLRQILVHLLKRATSGATPPARHGRAEIVGFHNDLLSTLTPSMRHRIDMDTIWRRAVRQARATLDAEGALDEHAAAILAWAMSEPVGPVTLDALAAEELDVDGSLATWTGGIPAS